VRLYGILDFIYRNSLFKKITLNINIEKITIEKNFLLKQTNETKKSNIETNLNLFKKS